VKGFFKGIYGYIMHQIMTLNIRQPKYWYNNIEYFVDENKYIMERVAMFSLLSLFETKNIAKT